MAPQKNDGLYISRWWIPILLGIIMAIGSSWAIIWSQAREALPRSEAATIYVPLDRYLRDQDEEIAWRIRIENKVDKLLNR